MGETENEFINNSETKTFREKRNLWEPTTDGETLRQKTLMGQTDDISPGQIGDRKINRGTYRMRTEQKGDRETYTEK